MPFETSEAFTPLKKDKCWQGARWDHRACQGHKLSLWTQELIYSSVFKLVVFIQTLYFLTYQEITCAKYSVLGRPVVVTLKSCNNGVIPSLFTSSNYIYPSKMIILVFTCKNLVKQDFYTLNILRLCSPQTLFSAIFQKLLEIFHWLFGNQRKPECCQLLDWSVKNPSFLHHSICLRNSSVSMTIKI